MATCEVCGNDYDKAFQVTVAGATIPSTASKTPTRTTSPTAYRHPDGHPLS